MFFSLHGNYWMNIVDMKNKVWTYRNFYMYLKIWAFLVSEKMAHEGNYCRNPDSSESPWCYVQGNTKHVKEKCTIPSCGKLYFVIKLLTDKFKASLEFHWKIRNENLKKCMFRNKIILIFDFFVQPNLLVFKTLARTMANVQ